MDRPIKIMIVDDHTMIREGIKQLLELKGDYVVIAEARSGKQCIQLLNKKKIDVLLLEINLPDMNGLLVLQHIREAQINVKVLMLTIHNEVEYLFSAKEIGTDGYILKKSNLSQLKNAIRIVYKGETFIQPELALVLKAKLDEKKSFRNFNFYKLSIREISILKLITEGLLNKEIAFILSISEKTVKNHIARIFKKIDVSDRTQAAMYAIKNNIVNISSSSK